LGGGAEDELHICHDFDVDYNDEIEIWIRLPVLEWGEGKKTDVNLF
jgi:hypothetical protein